MEVPEHWKLSSIPGSTVLVHSGKIIEFITKSIILIRSLLSPLENLTRCQACRVLRTGSQSLIFPMYIWMEMTCEASRALAIQTQCRSCEHLSIRCWGVTVWNQCFSLRIALKCNQCRGWEAWLPRIRHASIRIVLIEPNLRLTRDCSEPIRFY